MEKCMNLFFKVLGAIFSGIKMVYLIRSRHAKCKISSKLELLEGKPTAVIRVLKEGPKRLVIESIRLPLTVWDDSPRLIVRGTDKVIRIYDDFLGSTSILRYVSDKVVKYSDKERKMDEGDVLLASIGIDEMMEEFISSRESLRSPFFFHLMLLTFNVEVTCSNGKVFKQRLHRDIKLYLKRKYLNDNRLY